MHIYPIQHYLNKHFKMFVSLFLIISIFFGLSPAQIVYATSYTDVFDTPPFSGTRTQFETGSYSVGLYYSCYNNCYFQHGDPFPYMVSFPNSTGSSNFYFATNNGDSFVFSSIDILADYPVTITGSLSGSQVFSTTIPATTSGFVTVTPPAGDTVVSLITMTITSSYVGFKNVAVNIYPSLVSFTRQSPSTMQTNADSLVFRAIFSEGVQNVTADDFIVNSTSTATISAVTSVSTSEYNITVSGGDLANYNGDVSLDLNSSHDITTLGGEAVSTHEPTTDTFFTVDNINPAVSINQASTQTDPTNDSSIEFTISSNEALDAATVNSFDLDLSSSTATIDSTSITQVNSTTFTATVVVTTPGTVTANIVAGSMADLSGNTNSVLASTDNTVTFDNTRPNVTINQASTQADPTNTSPVNFTVVFDKPIDTSTFTESDIELVLSTATTGTVTITQISPMDNTTFNVSVEATSDGTVNAYIPQYLVSDSIGNQNTDSTSTDNTITLDTEPLMVTINQASTQSDPTGNSPIHFDVLFSKSVSNFDDSDVTLSGTAGANLVVVSGSGTTYDVAISGMTLDGTVIADIGAGVASDAAGNLNSAGTSTDNQVTYDGDPLMVMQRPAATNISTGGSDDIGNRPVGTAAITYTVDNTAGTDTLVITGVNASDLINSSNFQLLTATPISVPAGTSSTFDVSFQIGSAGTFNLQMHILNNDSDTPDYIINIEGTSYFEPEMEVSFNSNSITDGDATPSTSDGTDFGNDLVNYAPYSPEHTFTITNTGAGTLSLTGSPRVTVTGTDFSLVTDAPAIIAAGESATFVVRYAATSIGTETGTISIDNDDPNENPYNFSISGTGYSGSLMVVQGGSPSQDIENGDTSPDTADATEFMAVNVSGGTVDHTFTIQNLGDGALSLSGTPIVSITGTNAADFTVTAQPSASIASGSNSTFTIQFDPAATGNRTAIVSINSNDPENNPYTFTIQGQGDEFLVMPAGGTSPINAAVLSTVPSSLRVQFNRDALADGSLGAANYTGNYMLVHAGANNLFDTTACDTGVAGDDLAISIVSISYNNLSYIATLTVNSSDFAAGSNYQLFVCGTTSVEDIYGNELNGGTSDTVIGFSIAASGGGTSISATNLPATGFPVGKTSVIAEQPVEKQYNASNMTLAIPSLNVSLPIVGVPQVEDSWDVSWLDHEAGYLNGTAYPTWSGNTVITGHVWDAMNQPGPFARLKELRYGDLIEIYSGDSVYIYEVHDNRLYRPSSINAVIRHEDLDWVTLITCEDYQENNETYTYRRVIRAVLVQITTP